MGAPELTVISPALDEAERLPRLLLQLRRQRGVTLEILVADGGSRDETVGLARAGGARLLHTAPGRGGQMNAAAREAASAQLLFLHADSGLNDELALQRALEAMRRFRLSHGERCAGHFRLAFTELPPDSAALFRF
ncbi:MAG: glycosyltransferase, partial [Magnetococcus sp. YQC-5]